VVTQIRKRADWLHPVLIFTAIYLAFGPVAAVMEKKGMIMKKETVLDMNPVVKLEAVEKMAVTMVAVNMELAAKPDSSRKVM
jgi:hypothetical protein